MTKTDKITIDPETFARTILAGNPKGQMKTTGSTLNANCVYIWKRC